MLDLCPIGTRTLVYIFDNIEHISIHLSFPPYTYTYFSDMAACVKITEYVEISPSTVLNITSPGYPDVNYNNDTILTWNVTAPASTEEILIDIDMDIVTPPSGLCEDYLKVIFQIEI